MHSKENYFSLNCDIRTYFSSMELEAHLFEILFFFFLKKRKLSNKVINLLALGPKTSCNKILWGPFVRSLSCLFLIRGSAWLSAPGSLSVVLRRPRVTDNWSQSSSVQKLASHQLNYLVWQKVIILSILTKRIRVLFITVHS